jgi:IS30 family transposase
MSYTHLTQDERYLISHLHLAGRSKTQIGRKLGRSKGTISRELRRNAVGASGGYWNHLAHAQAAARRAAPRKPYKLREGPRLDAVQIGLLSHHSPQQIAGRLKLEHPGDPSMHISFEAIYLWAYRQGDPRWNQLLRKKHRRRSPRKRGGALKQGQIVGRVGIEERPAEVGPRTRLGDWESDTLCGEPGTGGVAVHVERLSRVLVAAKVQDRTAGHFAGRSLEAFRQTGVPRSSCLTLTADNGKEFAEFARLEKGLGLKVYFAHPHAPWERGTSENTNGLIREYFPKGTDFGKITKADVDRMTRSMNNRPRQCLGYQTPHEVFEKLAGVALQI